VIHRAMAKDPVDRFQSAGDFGRAIRAAIENTVPTVPERVVAVGEAAPTEVQAKPPSVRTLPLAAGAGPDESSTLAAPPPGGRRSWLVWPALLALGAAVALGAVWLFQDGNSSGIEGAQRDKSGPSQTTNPAVSPTTVTETTTSTGPTAPAVGSWPADSRGWTVILSSSNSRTEAESVATAASNEGEASGILNSSDFSSLAPGYWVAYAGNYGNDSDAAQLAADRLAESFPGSYPRLISP
jgi:hypothetical protein